MAGKNFKSKKRIERESSTEEAAPDRDAKRAKSDYAISTDKLTGDDGNTYWELSKTRRVQVNEFRGVQRFDIREYYSKDDKMLPGKKGISLSIAELSALIERLPQIEAQLLQVGEKLPRPEYSTKAEMITTRETTTGAKDKAESDVIKSEMQLEQQDTEQDDAEVEE